MNPKLLGLSSVLEPSSLRYSNFDHPRFLSKSNNSFPEIGQPNKLKSLS